MMNGGGTLLRVTGAAAMAGVSPRALYAWIARGVLPEDSIVRIGRAVYVRRAVFERWLAGTITEPVGGEPGGA